ncbi:MAG: DNA polymerase III subunit gamma/tau [Ignavibacteriae bacterium]|nr:MAG: DNA polymerase III subunit gamma/tau [Ignavibacteriota bacterium]
MAFIVTARKWRPQLFEEVVGQQHISTTLKNAIANNRVGHAYIFAGPRGVGKTTTARILAKRLNCLSPNGGEPCNECSSCKNFLKMQSLDIIEIDGASNRRIDEIRTLRESVKYAPTTGNYKVYIIDEVHMLTTESFNALLKTLEEPPEHTIFIFATTDIHKVPLTIISRCQRFDFRRIEIKEIINLLSKIAKAENISIDEESLLLIAKKADGALRDAESIFDQVVSFCGNKVDIDLLKKMLNIISDELYFEISDAVLSKNFKAGFTVSENIYKNGWNFLDFIDGLIEHFRNISTVIITDSTDFIEASDSLKKRYYEYADKFDEGDILRILSFLNKTQTELKISQNQKLKIEISLTHLIGFEKTSTITNLLNNLDNIESVKKKTKIINSEEDKKKSEGKLEFKIDYNLPTPKKSDNNSEKTEEKNNTQEVKVLSIADIKGIWKNFSNIVTEKKFTLGPLLLHTQPIEIKNDNLIIGVANQDDIPILENSTDLLSKHFEQLTKNRLKFQFNFEESLTTNSEKIISKEDEDLSKKYPLIKDIINELGGREI